MTGTAQREARPLGRWWPGVVRTVYDRDPAVKSPLEALLLYPGVHAIALHRVAHSMYSRRLFFLARLVSHISRWLTGIEIHPGARIGNRCFIDHGSGVVIGETAVIGDDVTIYQGVTLGGTGKETGKRHPTLESGAVIAAGAIVLGNITIGRNARVAAGAVVIRPVPPGATVVGVPGRVVSVIGRRTATPELVPLPPALDHANHPDPVTEALRAVETRLALIEEQLRGDRLTALRQ